MKRAVKLPQYSDTHDFVPPDGIELVKIDKVTNLLSDDACPDGYMAAFLTGTAPTDTCDHPADHRNILQKIFGLGNKPGNEVRSDQIDLPIYIGAIGHRLAVLAPVGDARIRALDAAANRFAAMAARLASAAIDP